SCYSRFKTSSDLSATSRMSSEDEYSALEEEEKMLLADIYPELKKKLERSVERSRKKRAPFRPAASKPPVFDISSDEDDFKVKREVVVEEVHVLDDSDVTDEKTGLSSMADVSADRSKQSEEYSFHSARSRVHVDAGVADESMLSSDEMSPPTSFTADEQELEEEMEGSFVANPRWSRSRSSSFEEVNEEEIDEQEPEGESLNESGCRARDEEEESIHTSDEEFIDDDEEGGEDSEMSIDRSFNPDVLMETPPNRRVLPARSTKNAGNVISGRSMPAPTTRRENPAAISPSASIKKRPPMEEERSDDDGGSGEESFELYLRKLRDEDEKKKDKKKREEEE
ncbi:hypothetical protein PFISCL1PPCAC_12500, partial [Pristionchus fissidentatus]